MDLVPPPKGAHVPGVRSDSDFIRIFYDLMEEVARIKRNRKPRALQFGLYALILGVACEGVFRFGAHNLAFEGWVDAWVSQFSDPGSSAYFFLRAFALYLLGYVPTAGFYTLRYSEAIRCLYWIQCESAGREALKIVAQSDTDTIAGAIAQHALTLPYELIEHEREYQVLE